MTYVVNGDTFGVRDLRVLFSIKNASKITPVVIKDIDNKFDRYSMFYTRDKLRELQKKGYVKVTGRKRHHIKELKFNDVVIQRESHRLNNSYIVTAKGQKIINNWLKKHNKNKLIRTKR